MTFTYSLGAGLSILRKPGRTGPPPPPRTVLTMSAGNLLYPEDIEFAPEWFDEDDFTLVTAGRTIEFLWEGDHWSTDGDFPAKTGLGNIYQGANSHRARYLDAELGRNYIVAADAVRITGQNGLYITWKEP